MSKTYNIVRCTSHPTDFNECKNECAIVKRVAKSKPDVHTGGDSVPL